jgi:hypothetical protein
MDNVKLLHIKSCFFKFFQSGGIKKYKKLARPKKKLEWVNDAPVLAWFICILQPASWIETIVGYVHDMDIFFKYIKIIECNRKYSI